MGQSSCIYLKQEALSFSLSRNMFITDLRASMKPRTNKSLTGEGTVGVFQLHALHLCFQINLDIDALGIG